MKLRKELRYHLEHDRFLPLKQHVTRSHAPEKEVSWPALA